MSSETHTWDRGGWVEAIGLPHILRTLGLAVHPAKLALALVAIVLTVILGGLLDWVWMRSGGVEAAAIANFIQARESDRPYVEAPGDRGLFQVWRDHERRCVLGLLGPSLRGASFAGGTPLGAGVEAYGYAQPPGNLLGMGYGVWWLIRCHPVYFILFGAGALLIWSWAGGAICRLAAVQFAREEKLTVGQALAYARSKLFDGFVVAPCIPLAFIAVTVVLMVLGGALLRLPVLGDLISGAAFGLAILGGFVVATLIVGLLVGGSLFWPTVAAESSDGFDAFSRGLSYPLTRPFKFVVYGGLTLIFASVCWVVVNWFTFFALAVTRVVVGFGTSPFGWWGRGEAGTATSKLDLLWPLSGPNALYAWPDWAKLAWHEYFSAVCIGAYVLVVVGLMWSFLVSFYFSGSTVIYFLLRRDVDGTDLEDVSIEGDESADASAAKPTASVTEEAKPGGSNISLPVTNAPGGDT